MKSRNPSSRGMFCAVGMGGDDWDNPQRAIASSWTKSSDTTSCSDELPRGRKVSAKVAVTRCSLERSLSRMASDGAPEDAFLEGDPRTDCRQGEDRYAGEGP